MTNYVHITSNGYFVTPISLVEMSENLNLDYLAFSIVVDKEKLIMILALQTTREMDSMGIVPDYIHVYGITITTHFDASQRYTYRANSTMTGTRLFDILTKVEKIYGVYFYHKEKSSAECYLNSIIAPVTEYGVDMGKYKVIDFLEHIEQAKAATYISEGLNIMKYPCGGGYAYAYFKKNKKLSEAEKEFRKFVETESNSKILGISMDNDVKVVRIKFNSVNFNQSADHYHTFALNLYKFLKTEYTDINFTYKTYIT